MKNNSEVPKQEQIVVEQENNETKKVNDKHKKRTLNLWPLKVFVISFVMSFAVNAGSELVLADSKQVVLPLILSVVILIIGVFFDIIGTASTSCDVQPFLAMASRKVHGAKLAVKLCQNSDVVSSICNDVVGDICGIVSGVCAATIANLFVGNGNFFISVLIYAVVSTATITLKAVGKSFAVTHANDVISSVAKFLSLFSKEG